MTRFRFRARCVEAASNDVYAALEAAAIAAARANNAALWYIGRDLSGVFEDSAGTIPAAVGSPIGLWWDRQYGVGSSSGHPASQATAASKPSLVLLSSGYWGATFDGADDHLRTATNFIGTNTSAYTIIVSAKHSPVSGSLGTRQILCDGRGVGVADSSLRVLHAGQGRYGAAIAGTLSPGVLLTASATYAGNGGVLTLRRNGIIDYSATVPIPTSVSSSVFLGQRNNAAEWWWGDIALACASSGVMSDPHRQAIERFAAHLMGTTYAG